MAIADRAVGVFVCYGVICRSVVTLLARVCSVAILLSASIRFKDAVDVCPWCRTLFVMSFAMAFFCTPCRASCSLIWVFILHCKVCYTSYEFKKCSVFQFHMCNNVYGNVAVIVVFLILCVLVFLQKSSSTTDMLWTQRSCLILVVVLSNYDLNKEIN